MMKTTILAFIMLLLFTIPVLAQEETPRFEALGAYSYMNASTSGLTNRLNLNGWNGALNINLNKWIGITSDIGGYYGSPLGISTHDFSFLFGPTFSYRTKKVTPFAHALFGGNRLGLSAMGESASDTGFAYAIGGGIDFPIHSIISVRAAQVDWLHTHHGDVGQNNVRVSAGAVFRFGH
jgi:hypothetical protein